MKKNIQWISVLCFAFGLLIFHSCQPDQRSKDSVEIDAVTSTEDDGAIEVITEAMDFQTVDTITSGWNTFRYINKSYEAHFFLMDKYPEGKTLKEGDPEVIQVFQKGMDLINDGKAEEGYEAFNALPAWFFEVEFLGGSGLVSPGRTSETTIFLPPGYYVMECYVKMGNGMFHSAMGMVKELVVTENDSGNEPPAADIEVSISFDEGITWTDTIGAGEQVFAVHFVDQQPHEHFVGHDVNLVRLAEDADIAALEKWMNWSDPKGLITPSPAGVTFLGGVNEMPAGYTGYFRADLEPGTYAFISEVPAASTKNMLKEFIVN
jgi:hypothetical protein